MKSNQQIVTKGEFCGYGQDKCVLHCRDHPPLSSVSYSENTKMQRLQKKKRLLLSFQTAAPEKKTVSGQRKEGTWKEARQEPTSSGLSNFRDSCGRVKRWSETHLYFNECRHKLWQLARCDWFLGTLALLKLSKLKYKLEHKRHTWRSWDSDCMDPVVIHRYIVTTHYG